ncbi:MAG: DUF4386 domain-containing protein [Bacteroidales bacterium]|nr:DUF4386 domain-containing protein [Bacteroidales bacterium]
MLITIAAAITGFAITRPELSGAAEMLKGAAGEPGVIWGAFCELLLAFSVMGSALILYPVLNKENESLAIGYVCFRLLEATLIITAASGLLSVATLSRGFSGAAAQELPAYLAAGKLLLAIHHMTFLPGPGLALGASTLMLSRILLQSKLVPRFIGIPGLAAGFLVFACAGLVMSGVIPQISLWSALLTIPVFAFETTLAIWLIVKGFNPTVGNFSTILWRNDNEGTPTADRK